MGAFDSSGINCISKTAIEFGAGTARLSERLQRVTNCTLNHILIDRQEFNQSQCRDSAMKKRANDNTEIKRIAGDIADFDLKEYCESGKDEVFHDSHKCFCFSKHLCGPAADLAIDCLLRLPFNNRIPFAFATCCHYLCTWESFSGKTAWKSMGLSKEDFEVSVAASQWYSLKSEKNEFNSKRIDEDGVTIRPKVNFSDYIVKAAKAIKNNTSVQPPSLSSDEFERAFTKEEKSKLGGTAKRLLDFTRAAKLQELGYDTELVIYTTQTIENRLLIGKSTTSILQKN